MKGRSIKWNGRWWRPVHAFSLLQLLSSLYRAATWFSLYWLWICGVDRSGRFVQSAGLRSSVETHQSLRLFKDAILSLFRKRTSRTIKNLCSEPVAGLKHQLFQLFGRFWLVTLGEKVFLWIGNRSKKLFWVKKLERPILSSKLKKSAFSSLTVCSIGG